jgi:hypothetical protein
MRGKVVNLLKSAATSMHSPAGIIRDIEGELATSTSDLIPPLTDDQLSLLEELLGGLRDETSRGEI